MRTTQRQPCGKAVARGRHESRPREGGRPCGVPSSSPEGRALCSREERRSDGQEDLSAAAGGSVWCPSLRTSLNNAARRALGEKLASLLAFFLHRELPGVSPATVGRAGRVLFVAGILLSAKASRQHLTETTNAEPTVRLSAASVALVVLLVSRCQGTVPFPNHGDSVTRRTPLLGPLWRKRKPHLFVGPSP
ncbi:hypothetical protein MRX96_056112 [Rhipicephalus microplus]